MKFDKYTKKQKVIKDLVHDYINLTRFDLQIIDSPYFQRLKDIKQLTSFHVYPSATHTRFEHSLGVLKLTREAVANINQNGYINKPDKKPIFSDELMINVSVAALLHDVGHSPFSHLGEEQFDLLSVQKEFSNTLATFSKTSNISFSHTFLHQASLHENVHELISCMLIMSYYYYEFSKEDNKILEYEFIMRAILGISYTGNDNRNVLISFINSSSLDMDKLDYIMRDSFYTGISTPQIDTQRLFSNMYIFSKDDVILGFTSRAIPTIQTIIEARDDLYMWVYNHHVAILTDFLYYYIFRRLNINWLRHTETLDDNEKITPDNASFYLESFVGGMPIEKFFSVKSIKDYLFSDSDVHSAIKYQYNHKDTLINESSLSITSVSDGKRLAKLLDMLFSRDLPKAWWKTMFEFSKFLDESIVDTIFRNELVDRASNIEKYSVKTCEEFRASLIELIVNDPELSHITFEEGDFFIVPRSNKFYSLEAISDIQIFLIENEFKGPQKEKQQGHIYTQNFTSLMPQRNYDAFFSNNAFYVYLHSRHKSHFQEIMASFVKQAKILIAHSS